MKFRTYTDNTDTEIYHSSDGDQVNSQENKFIFAGFSNKLHSYYKNRLIWIDKILRSKGVHLVLSITSTVDKIGDNSDAGEFSPEDIHVPVKNLIASEDGNKYFLSMDEEMGRGWAVLLKIAADGTREIITQEHRDSVIEELMKGDWIRSFGIDYQVEQVENIGQP